MTGAYEGRPLAVGTVRGVRSFRLQLDGSLTGPAFNSIWGPGENEARCLKQQPWGSRDDAPFRLEPGDHDMSSCQHGFYAYLDGSTDYRNRGSIEAVVEGWGECVIGTRGFRAMKARILALTATETIAPAGPGSRSSICDCSLCNPVLPQHHAVAVRRMRARYDGIPFFADFDDMLAAFPTSEPEPAPPRPTVDYDPIGFFKSGPALPNDPLTAYALQVQKMLEASLKRDLASLKRDLRGFGPLWP